MGKKHDVELAFSKRNPWLRYYGKTEQTGGITGLAGIIVHATILDQKWLRHPAYPEERGNYKSLRGAMIAFSTPYVESEIRLLSYEPVPHCRKERDLLPAKWLEGGETYIGEGAKIDNLVHVAHNLYIGRNAVVTAHVILCGSSRVEEGAWIVPNSSVLNRVVIGRGAKVGLGSVVTRDVPPYSVVYGSPAKEHVKSK